MAAPTRAVRGHGSGVNASRLAKWCTIGALAALVWVYWPALHCSARGMKSAELSSNPGTEVSGRDKARVDNARKFSRSFFGDIPGCVDRYPMAAAPSTKRGLFYGLVGAAFVFSLWSSLQRRRARSLHQGRF